MSYSKAQLVDMLVPGLAKPNGSTDREARAILESCSIEVLTAERVRQIQKGYLSADPPQPTPARPAAQPAPQPPQQRSSQPQQGLTPSEEAQVRELTASLERLEQSEDKLIRTRAEAAADKTMFQLRNRQQAEPQRRANQKKYIDAARAAFAALCQRNRIAPVEANFRLLFQAGAFESELTADQVVAANITALVPASATQIGAWTAQEVTEKIEQHNYAFQTMTPDQLRDQARKEAEANRQHNLQDQVDSQLEASRQRDEAAGYRDLPAEFTKQVLLQLVKMDTQKYKMIVKKYGSFNVTKRLQGRQ